MKNSTIILLILTIIGIVAVYMYNGNTNNESFTTTQENAEAISNVASLYNTGNFSVSNMTITDNTTANNMTVNGTFNLLPRGIIVTWNGSTAPAGWALCNGQNGTPDLRDRFIVGGGNTYNYGNTGGTTTHSHGSDNMYTAFGMTWSSARSNYIQTINRGSINGGIWTGVGTWTNANTSGTDHGTSPGSAILGNTDTSTNLPPYYALAFIMKL